MNIYMLTTKNDKVLIEAKNRKEAFAKFFFDILHGKISLSNIGHIVILHDPVENEFYALRTVPICCLLNLISKELAETSLQTLLDLKSRKEATELLLHTMEKDKWILNELENVRNYRR